MKLLLVHPDPKVGQSLGEGLRVQWNETRVLLAETMEVASRLLQAQQPDVVLIWSGSPAQDGLDLLRATRQMSDAPVLMLAESHLEADQIEALRHGADDYVVQPASAALLRARIDAVRRRGSRVRTSEDQPDCQIGTLSIWLHRHEVTVSDVPVKLTPLEYKLLHGLVRNAGEVVPSQVLLDLVWGPEYGATTQYLKVFVSRLRAKLERPGDPRYIQSVRGLGYRLVQTLRRP